ncbi:Retrovirus-related Pol polyprotein from transposon TNT 1-94 [Golovinomyces cichoracearum]|uniref:Retrovirus-related Pol polyprotein from transposon TNT 1-94 n=1 Tax=Golovinomyces cichoracearum TaxID=62708 RepID=A0A420IRA0_9PEZI|nr:Retrovirus-related Pol polyprotein from transposon TNT 1-94 [Golovinomyces cichoracearum]
MASYIDKIVTRLHLQHARLPRVPMTDKRLIQNDGVATPEQCKSYQQRIGNLIYPAVVLRPDISFAASILSRFNKNSSPEHIREVHHVIRYLAATKHMGIQYSGNIELEKLMIAASDASFADDECRRSTQGFLIKLSGVPITWQSSLQRTIVLSNTEAEIMALTSLG